MPAKTADQWFSEYGDSHHNSFNKALHWIGADGDRQDWGKGVTVAVLDTGVADHNTLDGTRITRLDLLDPDATANGDYAGHGTAVAMFLTCLLLAFFGMTRVVFAIVDGRPKRSTHIAMTRFVESSGIILPPLIFLGLSLWLGLFTPRVLQDAWSAAAMQVFPHP